MNIQLNYPHFLPNVTLNVLSISPSYINALNISHSSNISNISNFIPLEILNQEIQGESDEFKDLVSEELKNSEIAEE